MSSALAFAIPGRWTGGKREEDEMRRLMAQEAEAAKGILFKLLNFPLNFHISEPENFKALEHVLEFFSVWSY